LPTRWALVRFEPAVMQTRGFTLLEIILAIFVAVLVLGVTIPSVRGVFAERALNRTFEKLDELVRDAQTRSVTERQPYVLEWVKGGIVLRPLMVDDGEVAALKTEKKEAYSISFPAALQKKPAPRWTFWPTGTSEPAIVSYSGPLGEWSVQYDPLITRGEFVNRTIF
jgi:type II secretory pathway pseudopilin PulG